jgi:hypothetical protein
MGSMNSIFKIFPGCIAKIFFGFGTVSPLVVVDNLDIERVAVAPHKANPVLIVNPDTVLPRTLSAKRLQPVPGRHPEILQRHSSIQNCHFHKSPAPQARWEIPALSRYPQALRLSVTETRDHASF